MDISIIIVSWKVRDKLRENLRALYESQGGVNFEVFVVDNNSGDGTVEMVKNSFPEVKLIANQENLGFARANNQAIKLTRGEFILLLNPDMRVFSNTLVNMLNWLRANKQAAVAGCHLVNEQGETVKHVRRFPGIWDQLAIVLKLPHIFSGVVNKYLREEFTYEKAARVDSIRGGFFMIRTSLSVPLLIRRGEIPGKLTPKKILDERYFLWFEEVDYCRQIKEAALLRSDKTGSSAGQGGEVWYTPAAECLDYVGQSFKQLPRGQAQKYFRDSQLKYFKKWQPVWQYWLLKLAWPIGLLMARVGEKFGYKRRAKN